MLAGSRYFKTLTFLSPSSSQPGMQAKAGLILENEGFITLKVAQFFLTPGENDERPRRAPEDKHNPPASD